MPPSNGPSTPMLPAPTPPNDETTPPVLTPPVPAAPPPRRPPPPEGPSTLVRPPKPAGAPPVPSPLSFLSEPVQPASRAVAAIQVHDFVRIETSETISAFGIFSLGLDTSLPRRRGLAA